MGLGETGDWQGAVDRIVGLIKTGEDPLGGELPQGFGSGGLIEAFAREVAGEHETDLGMTLPLTLAGFSAAMQGAFRAPILRKWNPVDYIWVSTVVQFVGIASAGQKKSTLLNEIAGPLKMALDGVGGEHRRELVDLLRNTAVKEFGDAALNVGVPNHEADWQQVYAGGLCLSSTTDQGTPEGLRKRMAVNGGHRAILTAEPDVLRDISAYSKTPGGGSLRHFLSGWDQEAIDADRVAGDVNAIEPSLPCLIMVQPESFTRYTTGAADGTDDFVDRGVFSRMLLWESKPVGMTLDFPDLEDWPEDWDPGSGAAGGQLGVLREALGDSMLDAVRRSNRYRVSKGILHAYLEHTPEWPMPKPKIADWIRLGLDGAAGHKAAARVQQMRKIILDAVEAESLARPDHGAVLYAFAQRFTSHVMRLAAILSVADDPGGCAVVDTGHIEDVATRLMPWLWAGWWRIMADRLESNAAALVETNALKNHKGLDLSGSARILDAFPKLEKRFEGPGSLGGFTQGEVIKQAKLAFGKQERSKVHAMLEKEFGKLLAEGMIEKAPVIGAPSAIGKISERYRITTKGKNFAAGY